MCARLISRLNAAIETSLRLTSTSSGQTLEKKKVLKLFNPVAPSRASCTSNLISHNWKLLAFAFKNQTQIKSTTENLLPPPDKFYLIIDSIDVDWKYSHVCFSNFQFQILQTLVFENYHTQSKSVICENDILARLVVILKVE